jgi:hypothetical protein
MTELSQTVKIFIYEIKMGKIQKIYDKIGNDKIIELKDLKKHYFKITDKILYWVYLLKIFKNKQLAFDCFTNKNKYTINKSINNYNFFYM